MGNTSAVNVEVLARRECLSLLKTVPVGRLALTVGALPVVLPVNFRAGDRGIFFRSARGSKLGALVGDVVAFEVDSWEEDGSTCWSVLVQGVAEIVKDEDELAWVESGLQPWGAPADSVVVRVETTLVSGRRFRRSEQHQPPQAAATR